MPLAKSLLINVIARQLGHQITLEHVQVSFRTLPTADGQHFGAQTAYADAKAACCQCRNADSQRPGALVFEPGPHSPRPERIDTKTVAAAAAVVPDGLPEDRNGCKRTQGLRESVRSRPEEVGRKDTHLSQRAIGCAKSPGHARRAERVRRAAGRRCAGCARSPAAKKRPRTWPDEPGRRDIRGARAAVGEG